VARAPGIDAKHSSQGNAVGYQCQPVIDIHGWTAKTYASSPLQRGAIRIRLMEHFLSRNLVGRTRRFLNNDLRPGQLRVSSRMAKTSRERNAHQRRLKPRKRGHRES
jgi:hypothetical protein